MRQILSLIRGITKHMAQSMVKSLPFYGKIEHFKKYLHVSSGNTDFPVQKKFARQTRQNAPRATFSMGEIRTLAVRKIAPPKIATFAILKNIKNVGVYENSKCF